MGKFSRGILLLIGVASLAATAAYYFQQPWVVAWWPWPLSRLSAIFVASMICAAAASVLWAAASGELRALLGGSVNYILMYSGIAAFCFQQSAAQPDNTAIRGMAWVSVFIVVLCAAVFLAARKLPYRDERQVPVGVQLSMALFALLTFLVGLAMVTQRSAIFPWPLSPELSVIFGWSFLGSTVYFLHALTSRNWANARGQLIGFLAYDLVLIIPFINHFEKVKPELHLNLIVYLSVVVGSGLIAIYYLFIHPAYRLRLFPATRSAVVSSYA